MKLNTAMLCIECDEIFELESNNDKCPSCGNPVIVILTKWLKPIEKEEPK